jgi:hypothetical protein
VLLHYVGYGYARRGCPYWLGDGLKKWRASGQRRVLITMFYEVYASGPPWRSSFWTAPFQRSIAAALARTSEACRTNMRRYARILERISGKAGISVMPVFSNVGEASSLKPYGQRKRCMVVFGGATWRTLIYTEHRSELLAAFRTFDLEELVDIGPPLGVNVELPIPFRKCGPLSASDVSITLEDAMAGVLCYPPEFLGKSGIFAAYAAHGVVPVLLGKTDSLNEDGLREDREYVTVELLKSCDLDDISRAANSWYAPHNLASTARAYAQVIADVTS